MTGVGTYGFLAAWGTLAGVDLVTGPQGLLARPLVAGAVAGLLLGNPLVGTQVGATLELFALDVLPVGASRYPDYGPATVAATAFAVEGGGGLGVLGAAATLGLLLAALGGWTMERLRAGNAKLVRNAADQLAAGVPGVAGRLQVRGAVRDAARSALLALLGVGLALGLSRVVPGDWLPDLLGIVVVAGGAYATTAGALRRAVRGHGRFWVAAGMAAGTVALALIP